jgi:transposase-like protein
MKRTSHPQEFREQALRKLRERGPRTQQSIADELNISLATLKGWLTAQSAAARGRRFESFHTDHMKLIKPLSSNAQRLFSCAIHVHSTRDSIYVTSS